MDRFIRRLCCALAAAALSFGLSGTLLAAPFTKTVTLPNGATATATATASAYTPSNLNYMMQRTGTGLAPLSKNISIPVSPASLARAAKAAAKGTPATAALIAGLEFLLEEFEPEDEENPEGPWVRPNECATPASDSNINPATDPDDVCKGVYATQAAASAACNAAGSLGSGTSSLCTGGSSCATTCKGACGITTGATPTYNSARKFLNTVNWWFAHGSCPSGTSPNASNRCVQTVGCATKIQYVPDGGYAPTPVTDEDIGERFGAAPNPQSVVDAYKDPDYDPGADPEVGPPLEDHADDWDQDGIPDSGDNYVPDTGTTTSPDPAQNTGSTSGTTTTTTTPTGSTSTTETTFRLPAFCDWAGVVCQFFDWFKNPGTPPEDVELPIEEIEEGDEYADPIGGGSCPAPQALSFLGNSLELSYQPACDAVVMFKPVLLLIASIIAARILMGVSTPRGED